ARRDRQAHAGAAGGHGPHARGPLGERDRSAHRQARRHHPGDPHARARGAARDARRSAFLSGRDERELLVFASALQARYHQVHAPARFRTLLRGSLHAAPVAFAVRRPSPFGRLALRSALAPILVLALLAATASADHLARLQSLATKLPAAAQHGIQRAIEVQQTVHGKSGNAPGRGGSLPLAPTSPAEPVTTATPARPIVTPSRGGPPSGV